MKVVGQAACLDEAEGPDTAEHPNVGADVPSLDIVAQPNAEAGALCHMGIRHTQADAHEEDSNEAAGHDRKGKEAEERGLPQLEEQ